jgi:hypothetical protein
MAEPIKFSWCTEPARDFPSVAPEMARATGTLATPCTPRPRPIIAQTGSSYRRTRDSTLWARSLEGLTMVGRFVSRRSLVAWCAAISLGGCAEDEATKVAKDPYLPTMMKGPLYAWRPTGDLTRTEGLSPKSTDNLASGTVLSRILIKFFFRTTGDADSLFQEAQRISSQAGYIDSTRVLLPGVNVECMIAVTSDHDGIVISLTAPA